MAFEHVDKNRMMCDLIESFDKVYGEGIVQFNTPADKDYIECRSLHFGMSRAKRLTEICERHKTVWYWFSEDKGICIIHISA